MKGVDVLYLRLSVTGAAIPNANSDMKMYSLSRASMD